VQRPVRELDTLRTGERPVRVAGSTALPEAAEFTLDVSAASGDGGQDSTSRAAGISIPAGLRISNDRRSRGPQLVGNDRLAVVSEHFDGRAIDDDAQADAAIDRAHGPRVPAWIMRERCSTRAPAVHDDLER
jgi:hypothetical protein